MRKKRMWVQSVGCYIITKTSKNVRAMQIGWKLRPRKYLDEIWIPFKTAWCISSCWGVSKIAAGDWVSVVRTKRSTISWPILLSFLFCMVYPLWPMQERNHWPRARLVSISFFQELIFNDRIQVYLSRWLLIGSTQQLKGLTKRG